MIDLDNGTLGAYFQCFRNKTATENVLINFRQWYPDSPILLVSDNGDDFSDLAYKYTCHYSHRNINMGLNNLGIDEALEFCKRLSSCLFLIKTDNLLILEDDVLVKNKLYGKYNDTMIGPYFGNEFNPITREILKRYRGIDNPPQYFGGSGGSVINWSEVASRIEDEYNDLCLFLRYIYGYPKEIGQQRCIDYLLSTIVAFLGGTYGKLDCLDEIIRNPHCINNPKISVIHQYKKW